MGLLLIGLIVIIIALASGRANTGLSRFKGILIIAGIVLMVIGFATSAIRQINSGTVGVQILFGEVQENILHEGLRLVNPLVNVEEMSIRTQNYTMSSTFEEGQKTGDDAVRVLSQDGLEVKIDLTLLYRVNPTKAPSIYRQIGLNFENIIIRPVARSGIRISASRFDAIELFAEKRQEFENSILSAIQDTLTKRGFIIDQLLIRNIDLPESVKESIERKITAVQEAQRMEYVLQKEGREAERKRVEARGVADAQKIVNEGLSDRILQFEMIKIQKELVNSPNSKIIILGNQKNTPPFILGN